MDSECIFCKIATGEIETEFVAESEHVVAFNDIDPQAPTHILVVPKRHYTGLRDIDDPVIDAEVLSVIRKVAQDRGLLENGYRVVTNDGPNPRQSVWHVHFHVLGDTKMSGKMV